MLGNTITGTIYAGIRARTTAAPQQHWRAAVIRGTRTQPRARR